MKKLMVGAVASLIATAAHAGETEWENSGIMSFGASYGYADQTDDPYDGWKPGTFGSASLLMEGNQGTTLRLDLVGEASRFNTDEQAPSAVIVIGAHWLHQVDAATIGAFVGFGGQSSDDDSRGGWTAGLETEFPVFDNSALFGQVGHADASYTGNCSGCVTEGFKGLYGRAGIRRAASDNRLFQAEFGYGKSPDFFEDGDDGSGDDWGEYYNWGAEFLVRGNRLPVIWRIGYEGGEYTANTEDDGTIHSIKLGFVVPFGDRTGKAQLHQAANSLKMPLGPFRAAAWSETLD